ncbi:hypothetical protein H0H87_001856 [Tephrocybe sp. NHM501043]|nr:hypothetical protein H0H87_001856 [Tephrocybe sp. NHM501043]
MSALARFLRAPPASRRAYSSFFSSKVAVKAAAAKPSKAAVKAAAANVAAEPVADPVQPTELPSPDTLSAPAATEPAPHTACPAPDFHLHPLLNPKDFKLHQFFSLHRPLLLLARPHSILESANAPSFLPEANHKLPHWLLDEFPEATPDADAAAARQLARAMTMTHAGAAVAWEATLRRLGLDVTKDADRVGLQEKWDKEWQDVLMDSTKRKRKKKMRKHKLKKRRKATRAQRLKIGR